MGTRSRRVFAKTGAALRWAAEIAPFDSLARLLQRAPRPARLGQEDHAMRIADIMSQPAVTCQPNQNLNAAADLMWRHDCGAIPVVDDQKRVVGIITDRDVCMAAYTQGKSLSEIPVSTAMAKQVFTCHPDDPIEAAEHLMQDRQVRRVPVVDGQTGCVGVLSLNDVVRASAGRRGNGMQREVVETLSAIGTPRQRSSAARAH
jgi:CBS domain-containing protein